MYKKNTSVSSILNNMGIEKIDTLSIDNDNATIKIGLTDSTMNTHVVELLGVDNYHFLDETFYEDDQELLNKPVLFYDTMLSLYLDLETDIDGTVLGETFVEPNFVMDSPQKSVSARAKKIKIDGVGYRANGSNLF